MVRILVAATLLALLPAMAAAEPCGKRADFLDILNAEYGEAPISVARGSSGEVVEVFASRSGTWTVIVTNASGHTCGVAAGQAWLPPHENAKRAGNTSL